MLNNLIGTPRKVFKVIYKNYNNNCLINHDELKKLFTNINELEEDLTYLINLGLIYSDNYWYYHSTPTGRMYFKNETSNSLEIIIKSIFCPIIVSFLTTLITLLLKELL